MNTQPSARVHSYEERGTFVVVVSGEFDMEEQELLLAAWGEAERRNLPVTAVDLSGVTFGDSSFIHGLSQGWLRHRDSGRKLVLAGPLHPRLEMLLDLTGVLEHFDTVASLADALTDSPEEPAG
ncbi:STAS domain-containing protein [Streptomyces californicus]|uniref:STAS domain-containing protein n=1 Tax=Streptomyces californicus TaxID=67351 RepID=UPI0033D11C10